MGLIAPLFLLGIGLIALPIWLHRMNTLNPERHPFPSAMLLEQSKRTLIQKKLKYLLLMALRIGFISLLMLAFAKPLIPRPPVIIGGNDAVLHMIVMDTSFSMNYGDRFDDARAVVREIVSDIGDDDIVQLIAASNNVEILMEPTGIIADIEPVLEQLQPGYGRLDMGNMIVSVDRLINEYELATQVHLISDFQESALPSKFADLVPDSLKDNLHSLRLYQTREGEIDNAYIDSVMRIENGIEVAVRSGPDISGEATVEISLNDETLASQSIEFAESGLTLFDFPLDEVPDGESRLVARLINDDPLGEDNVRYFILDNSPPRPVLLLTENSDALSVKYLTAAVESGQQGYRVEPVKLNDLDPRIVQRYPWIIVDDMGIINETLVTSIQEYLQNGGAIFAALGDRAASRNSVPVVDFEITAERLASDISVPYTVSAIDLSHPALAETSGWRDIRVSRYLGLNVGNEADILVTLEDGSPLVIEKKTGNGRVLLLTSSLDNSQNDLPVRPVFVNYVAEAAKYLSGEQQLKQNQVAGDFLQLVQTGSAAGQIIDPQGSDLLSLAETHRSQDIKLNLTGFYEIYTADTESLVAVNPDLRESEQNLMSSEAISAWRDAITAPENLQSSTGPVNIEQDSIEIWHILLVLMGIVVMIESIIGNHYLGYRRGYT